MRNYLTIVLILLYSLLLSDGVQPIGSGTEMDPYQVETLDNLLWVSTNNSSWSSYFIQTSDISAADTQTWNNGEGFSPIGDIDNPFTGNYDGQFFLIVGLYIDNTEEFNRGLFGKIIDSSLENVTVFCANITGNFNVGGLIAHAYNSTIYNCSSEGSITGGTNVGGLVGIAENSSISYSSSSVGVIAEEFVGGLIGQCYITSLDNCSSFGQLEAIANLGGLAGLIFNSEINNCYSRVFIDAFMSAGGLAGTIMNGTVVNKCYSSGSIINGVADIGGLIGMNLSSSAYNSFWDIDTSGLENSDGGTGKYTSEMYDIATYTDLNTIGLDEPWDFVGNPFDDVGTNDYWHIFEFYPQLTPVDYVSTFEETISDLSDEVLLVNYPNPFNPTTEIRFQNLDFGEIKSAEIVVFNLKGQKVKTLPVILSGVEGSVTWNGTDQNEKPVSSGIYLYKLISNEKIEAVNRCVLFK